MHRPSIFALLLGLMIILSLAACGAPQADADLQHSFIQSGKVHTFVTRDADKVAAFRELWDRLLARDETLEGVTFLDEFPGVHCKANLQIGTDRLGFYFDPFSFDGKDYDDVIFVSVRPENVDTERAVIAADSATAQEILALMEYLKTEGEEITREPED